MDDKVCSRCIERKPIDAFRLQPYRNFRLSHCRQCEAMAAADRHARNRSTWASTSTEARQAERRRAAEKAGRVYMPLDEFRAATAQQTAAKREAWEAEKARRAVQRAIDREERRKTKPWLWLSVADKYRLRYELDPVFRAKEVARTAVTRTKRGGVSGEK